MSGGSERVWSGDDDKNYMTEDEQVFRAYIVAARVLFVPCTLLARVGGCCTLYC